MSNPKETRAFNESFFNLDDAVYWAEAHLHEYSETLFNLREFHIRWVNHQFQVYLEFERHSDD